MQLLANGAPLRPVLPRESLIDNNDRRRIGAIMIGEIASRNHGCAERAEESWTNHPMPRGLIFWIPGPRQGKKMEWQPVIEILSERKTGGCAGGLHSWQRRRHLADTIERIGDVGTL